MSFRIRKATAADVAGMHRLRKRVRENRLSIHTSITEKSYVRYIAAGSAWVAERDGGLSGFAAIDEAAASVWALFVDPEVEGTGVGRALHDTMLEWAREQRLPRLFLSTEENSRAARFYKQGGWTRTGVTPAGEVYFVRSLGI
jgi:GNAT superfamily N-acetyltransferase